MNINHTLFSGTRFINLLRKDLTENWKKHLLRFILVFGGLTLFFLWLGSLQYLHNEHRIQYWTKDPVWNSILPTLILGIFISGCLSASFINEKMISKTGRTSVLMLPATMFEKFLSRWIIFCIAYPLVFLLAFKLADFARVLIYSSICPEITLISPFSIMDTYDLFINDNEKNIYYFHFFTAFFFFLQSFFVLGSTLWPKNAFLKTFTAGLLLTILWVGTGIWSLNTFIPNNFYMAGPPFGLSETGALTITITVIYLFALFFLALAYYRFKESEIINRW